MKNIEIKPFKALIPLEEYLNQYPLVEGDSLWYQGRDWKIHSIMPAFDTVIVTNDKKEVDSIKLHNGSGDYVDMFVIATCVLKSNLSSIIGVEQLNLFKDE
jgi:hypothetical protein